MAKLADATKKIGTTAASNVTGAATRTAAAVAGVASAGLRTVTGNVINQTGIRAARPSNILAATAESLGIGGVIPAISSAMDKILKKQSDVESKVDNIKSTQVSNGSFGELVKLTQSIADSNLRVIDLLTKQNNILEEANNLVRRQTIVDEENRRESRAGVPAAAARVTPSAEGQAGAKAGFLSGIVGAVNSALSSLGIVGKFIAGIGSVLGRLVAFVLRFNPFLLALSAVLLGAEKQDFAMFFDNMAKVFDDIINGEYFTAFIRAIGSIGDIIFKGIGRIVAKIVAFFGFEDAAKAINDFLDSVNLADFLLKAVDLVVEAIKSIGTFLSDAAKAIGSFVSGIFNFIVDGAKAVYNFFAGIPEAVSNAISSIGDFFASIGSFIMGGVNAVLDFFKGVKDFVVEKFNSVVNFFSEFWNSFSLIDIISAPFIYIKDTVTNIFGKLKDSISEILGFDLVGNIASSVGSVVTGIWDFFKSIPGKAVDLLSGLVPDFLKNSFRGLFGGKATPAAAPAPAAAPREVEAAPPGEARPRTRAVPRIGGIPNMEFVGKSQEEIFDVLVQRYANADRAKSEAERIYKGLNTARPTYGTGTSISSVLPDTYSEAMAASKRQQMSQNQAAAPVIINNSNSIGGQQSGPASNPRVSGAVSTAPSTTASDRVLYGTEYGDGNP